MIRPIPTEVDLESAYQEARTLTFRLDGSGATMAFPPNKGIPKQISDLKSICHAVSVISNLTRRQPLHLMINQLGPGIQVPIHTDTLLGPDGKRATIHHERWHLPLRTNNRASWWDSQGGDLCMLLGYWWGPVPYWLEHSVKNLGGEERIHLVIDLV